MGAYSRLLRQRLSFATYNLLFASEAHSSEGLQQEEEPVNSIEIAVQRLASSLASLLPITDWNEVSTVEW